MQVFVTSDQSRPHLSFLKRKRLRLFALVLIVATVQVGFSGTSAFAQNIQVTPSALTATVSKGQSTTLTLNLQKTGTDATRVGTQDQCELDRLSPAYGSSNTITTELDQVRATVNTASLAVGTNSGLVYIRNPAPASRVSSPYPSPLPSRRPAPPRRRPRRPHRPRRPRRLPRHPRRHRHRPRRPSPPPASPPPRHPVAELHDHGLPRRALGDRHRKGQSTTLTLNFQKTGTDATRVGTQDQRGLDQPLAGLWRQQHHHHGIRSVQRHREYGKRRHRAQLRASSISRNRGPVSRVSSPSRHRHWSRLPGHRHRRHPRHPRRPRHRPPPASPPRRHRHRPPRPRRRVAARRPPPPPPPG